MEFDYSYPEEIEQFRQEVRSWIRQSVPFEMKEPVDLDDLTEEMYLFWRQKHKELGAKGWLYPAFPKEYGGGGLSPEHAAIIEEEFQRGGVIGSFTVDFGLSALLVWATEEQKQKFLVPILNGEKIASMKFTEPHSGSDAASYESRAVRDGDDWILNGSNVFITCLAPGRTPDLLYGPLLTDPEAPRHRNLGYFMVPYPTSGLTLKEQTLLSGRGQYFVYLDNVRVSGDHLIGGDHQGWQVAMTTSEREHGGEGAVFRTDKEVTNLLLYMKGMRQKRLAPSGDPVLQQIAVDVYIDGHTAELFDKRTSWMYLSGRDTSWEGPFGFMFERVCGMRNASRIRHVIGMYTLLGSKEPLAPLAGVQEVSQRQSFIHQHGAGSFNITKVIVARRIGISRTKERAAVTPMAAARGASGERS